MVKHKKTAIKINMTAQGKLEFYNDIKTLTKPVTHKLIAE